MLLLTWFKFFKSNDLSNINTIEKREVVRWISYKRETFNNDGKLEDYSDNGNYIIEMEKNIMTICTFEPDNCDTFEYKMKNGQYIMITNDEKLINANLEIRDVNNMIQIVKTSDDGDGWYSIFYFNKIEEEF